MKKIIFLFLSFGLFTSCNLMGFKIEIKFDQETFKKQRQQWQAANIKNYSYRLQGVGFFNYDGTIIVENGEYKDNIPSGNSDEINVFMGYTSIDEIYRTIDLFFSSNNNKKPQIEVYLKEISVVYDEVNHIPVEIHYINHIPPGTHVSGIFDYYVSNFNK